jgi:acetyl-CoA C-acetyltransferase
MQDVYIVCAKRTPIGNFMGSLSSLSSIELGSAVIKDILKRTKVDPKLVSEVIVGQVLMGGLGQNPARQAAMMAQLPQEVPSYNVSQVCGSGLKAVALGFQAIRNNDSECVIVGGQESMSQGMHASFIRGGIKMGNASLVDMMQYDGLTCAFGKYSMGITAENMAKKFRILREAQDEFAYFSQQRAHAAQEAGKFIDEIVPIEVFNKKGNIIVDKDEFIKKDTTIESLEKLKPAFSPNGTVTAGNSSGINDGAAFLMLASESFVKKHNLKPMARILGYSQVGIDPSIMGAGPIPAIRAVMKRCDLTLNDVDLIEANEAFAVQYLAVREELFLNDKLVNVNGGAIALGHPIGASGARILVTLVHEMAKRKDKKIGMATLCVGGGMGLALVVQKIK